MTAEKARTRGLIGALLLGCLPASLLAESVSAPGRTIRLRPHEHGIFLSGDRVIVETTGSWIAVRDWYDREVYRGPPGHVPIEQTGHFFVTDGHDRTQFAVLPADYRGAPFLGMEATRPDLPFHVAVADRVRPGWVRVLSRANWWATVQPQPDAWNWAPLDAVVEHHHGRGRKIVVTTWLRPRWVTDEEFMPRYSEYVRRVADRYRDRIHAIEIWNEPHWEAGWARLAAPEKLPHLRSADDVVPQYARLLCAGYKAVREVSTNIMVVGAAWTRPRFPDRWAEFVRAGGEGCFDVWAFHDYYRGRVPPDEEGRFPDGHRSYQLPRLVEEMAEFRRLVGRRPLWMNEGGLYGRSALGLANSQRDGTALLSGLPWRRAVARAIKWVVLYRLAGVELILPHVLSGSTTDPQRNIEIYGWEFDYRGPHPKTSAFLMACYRLAHATSLHGRHLGELGYAVAWRDTSGETVVAAWAREGHRVHGRPNDLPPAQDVFGNNLDGEGLTEEPRFYRFGANESPEEALTRVAAALH